MRHVADGGAAASGDGMGKKRSDPDFLADVRDALQGAVTYSPTFAVPSAW